MDPELVFSLFEDPEDQSGGETKEIVDFSEHPLCSYGYVYPDYF
jgi:hypothetical protein